MSSEDKPQFMVDHEEKCDLRNKHIDEKFDVLFEKVDTLFSRSKENGERLSELVGEMHWIKWLVGAVVAIAILENYVKPLFLV